MAGEDVQVALLDGVPGAQVVLEGAVDEVDDALAGPAEQAAAEQERAQYRTGVTLARPRRDDRQMVMWLWRSATNGR